MIFTVRVVDEDNQQSEEPLAFVRYYAVKPFVKKLHDAALGVGDRTCQWSAALQTAKLWSCDS